MISYRDILTIPFVRINQDVHRQVLRREQKRMAHLVKLRNE